MLEEMIRLILYIFIIWAYIYHSEWFEPLRPLWNLLTNIYISLGEKFEERRVRRHELERLYAGAGARPTPHTPNSLGWNEFYRTTMAFLAVVVIVIGALYIATIYIISC